MDARAEHAGCSWRYKLIAAGGPVPQQATGSAVHRTSAGHGPRADHPPALADAASADQIVVLDNNGRITEQGTHQELDGPRRRVRRAVRPASPGLPRRLAEAQGSTGSRLAVPPAGNQRHRPASTAIARPIPQRHREQRAPSPNRPSSFGTRHSPGTWRGAATAPGAPSGLAVSASGEPVSTSRPTGRPEQADCEQQLSSLAACSDIDTGRCSPRISTTIRRRSPRCAASSWVYQGVVGEAGLAA